MASQLLPAYNPSPTSPPPWGRLLYTLGPNSDVVDGAGVLNTIKHQVVLLTMYVLYASCLSAGSSLRCLFFTIAIDDGTPDADQDGTTRLDISVLVVSNCDKCSTSFLLLYIWQPGHTSIPQYRAQRQHRNECTLRVPVSVSDQHCREMRHHPVITSHPFVTHLRA